MILALIKTTEVAPIVDSEDKKVVGELLANYKNKGYVIVLTEAGMIPYYSKWYVIDAWGLNDEFIAHNGLSFNYIEKFNPEIIQFHVYYAYYPDGGWTSSHKFFSSWYQMTTMLYSYATENNYTLACIIASSINNRNNGYQWYFLKPDFPDYQNLLNDINGLPVNYILNGNL